MTLDEMQTSLIAWEKALAAVARNQSYTIDGLTVTRADVAQIRETIDWLETRIARLQRVARGRGSVRYVG